MNSQQQAFFTLATILVNGCECLNFKTFPVWRDLRSLCKCWHKYFSTSYIQLHIIKQRLLRYEVKFKYSIWWTLAGLCLLLKAITHKGLKIFNNCCTYARHLLSVESYRGIKIWTLLLWGLYLALLFFFLFFFRSSMRTVPAQQNPPFDPQT